jgi:hypothetical protein
MLQRSFGTLAGEGTILSRDARFAACRVSFFIPKHSWR